MPLTFKPSIFKTSFDTNTNLVDTTLKQSSIVFPGGYILSFVDALSGVVDVDVCSHSIFYLTSKSDLSEKRLNVARPVSTKYVSTKLMTSTGAYITNTIVSRPKQSFTSNPNTLDVEYTLHTTDLLSEAATYRVEFIDDEYCTISHTDIHGVSYLAIDNYNKCVLRRGYNYDENNEVSELYFKYIIGEGKISFVKTIYGGEGQVRVIGNQLCVELTPTLSDTQIQVHSFKMDKQTQKIVTDLDDINYIKYKPNTVVVDVNNSYRNLKNNFLMVKNLNVEDYNNLDVIALKNQMSDLNTMVRGSNMVLSSGNTKLEKLEVDMRGYTSINKAMPGASHHDLEINYSSYNAAYKILPGANTIATGNSIYPYKQININDTKFVNCGAFSSLTPEFADRISLRETNNKGEDYTFLCTWLSGAPLSNDKKWVDRYYYPDLVTKQAAITSPITFTSYDKYVQDSVVDDSNLIAAISRDYVFDVDSNMIFTPNSEYIYNRIDLNNLDFVPENNLLNDDPRSYYEEINRNNGFTFCAKLRNLGNSANKIIKSEFDRIPAGLDIKYSTSKITIAYTFYDNQTGRLTTVSGALDVDNIVTSNVVLTVDNFRGIIIAYVNGIKIIDESFPSLKYTMVLFGNLTVDGASMFESSDYLIDPLLSNNPLSRNQTEVLNCKYNTIDNELTLTLPQGQRNNIDAIRELNSLQANKNSKANDIDVFINDIEMIDDKTKAEIVEILRITASDDLPSNTSIRNIEVL